MCKNLSEWDHPNITIRRPQVQQTEKTSFSYNFFLNGQISFGTDAKTGDPLKLGRAVEGSGCEDEIGYKGPQKGMAICGRAFIYIHSSSSLKPISECTFQNKN